MYDKYFNITPIVIMFDHYYTIINYWGIEYDVISTRKYQY